jgi:hypothetical protein
MYKKKYTETFTKQNQFPDLYMAVKPELQILNMPAKLKQEKLNEDISVHKIRKSGLY